MLRNSSYKFVTSTLFSKASSKFPSGTSKKLPYTVPNTSNSQMETDDRCMVPSRDSTEPKKVDVLAKEKNTNLITTSVDNASSDSLQEKEERYVFSCRI